MPDIHCSQREDSREKSCLPPTKDEFGFHISRAFFELSIWSSACDAIANNLDPLYHGWQLENDILTVIMTILFHSYSSLCSWVCINTDARPPELMNEDLDLELVY